jgi:hypothetical protein
MSSRVTRIVLASATLLVNFTRPVCAQSVISCDPQGTGGLDLYASPSTGASLPFGVAFTPGQDMTFGGVSLSMENYSVDEFYGNLELGMHVSLYGPGVSENYSSQVLNNSFSGTVEFDFSNPTGPTVLQADQEYYLELTITAIGSGDPMADEYITWAAGGPLNGNAAYDGLYTYGPTPGFNVDQPPRYFKTDGDPMAFSVTAVPEPSTISMGALVLFPLGITAVRSLRNNRAR